MIGHRSVLTGGLGSLGGITWSPGEAQLFLSLHSQAKTAGKT